MLWNLVVFAGMLSLSLADDDGFTQATFTPQVQYASSMGVLGCKINTNRVGYLPIYAGCDNFCVQVKYTDPNTQETRSVNILHVDNSGGAHDISADAFTYLVTGKGAVEQGSVDVNPTQMEYKVVTMDQCHDLFLSKDNKMPVIAINPDAVSNCIANQPNSWLANNYALYNYRTSCCNMGVDDPCQFPDLAALSVPPTCRNSQLGDSPVLACSVSNINLQGVTEPAVC